MEPKASVGKYPKICYDVKNKIIKKIKQKDKYFAILF